jgi:hypothetical protein
VRVASHVIGVGAQRDHRCASELRGAAFRPLLFGQKLDFGHAVRAGLR